MTATPPQPAPTCCGQGLPACPDKPGQPLVLACQWCPQSPTYWRTKRAAAR